MLMRSRPGVGPSIPQKTPVAVAAGRIGSRNS